MMVLALFLATVGAPTKGALGQPNSGQSVQNRTPSATGRDDFASNGNLLPRKRPYGPWIVGLVGTAVVSAVLLKRPGRSYLD
jgi:hypothetical protein